MTSHSSAPILQSPQELGAFDERDETEEELFFLTKIFSTPNSPPDPNEAPDVVNVASDMLTLTDLLRTETSSISPSISPPPPSNASEETTHLSRLGNDDNFRLSMNNISGGVCLGFDLPISFFVDISGFDTSTPPEDLRLSASGMRIVKDSGVSRRASLPSHLPPSRLNITLFQTRFDTGIINHNHPQYEPEVAGVDSRESPGESRDAVAQQVSQHAANSGLNAIAANTTGGLDGQQYSAAWEFSLAVQQDDHTANDKSEFQTSYSDLATTPSRGARTVTKNGLNTAFDSDPVCLRVSQVQPRRKVVSAAHERTTPNHTERLEDAAAPATSPQSLSNSSSRSVSNPAAFMYPAPPFTDNTSSSPVLQLPTVIPALQSYGFLCQQQLSDDFIFSPEAVPSTSTTVAETFLTDTTPSSTPPTYFLSNFNVTTDVTVPIKCTCTCTCGAKKITTRTRNAGVSSRIPPLLGRFLPPTPPHAPESTSLSYRTMSSILEQILSSNADAGGETNRECEVRLVKDSCWDSSNDCPLAAAGAAARDDCEHCHGWTHQNDMDSKTNRDDHESDDDDEFEEDMEEVITENEPQEEKGLETGRDMEYTPIAHSSYANHHLTTSTVVKMTELLSDDTMAQSLSIRSSSKSTRRRQQHREPSPSSSSSSSLASTTIEASPSANFAATLPPVLPPLMPLPPRPPEDLPNKRYKTTTSAQARHFQCTIPGCTKTFTRRFNLEAHLRCHEAISFNVIK
ncbi:hypothetical protein HK102_007372 [Quaeritorhiza haematococci]|nr:hypothetical protein HK102_007372 [Quaeritorhiza haematococci]